MTEIFKSTCSYCGVGCGVEVLRHADGRLELRGDESHPANRGLLCSKGRSLLHTVNARSTRLSFPVMRSARGEMRERVSWDAAIARIAGDFRRIIADHGPDAVALYISGQCLIEEYYLANKLARGFLGTNNIDTNSRLCMSSAVCGYKATLGADAPPVCYGDIDLADTFLIAGANPAWCHPVLFRRIEARKAADPGVKIIVIDPRRTASAQTADLHLPLKPGTDVALFLGLGRRLVHTHQMDHAFVRDHVEGVSAFLESVEPWTLARTAEVTGLEPHHIAQAAEWLSGDRRFLSMWTMGLNQSAAGTDKNIALISLSLLTGKIGKPGCGPFSLTGQPNAMGGREVGGMATLLSAHRDISNPAHRAEVANFWGVPAIPDKPGLTAVELFDALASGKVKAVWIIATNPAATLPSSWNAEKGLTAAEIVVVQDIYPTETSAFADVLLPAAGWLEKTGTMTNSDRRITLLEKALDPPGEALPDAEILLRFALAMGWERAFNFASPADIFAEHAALTAGTDIDITGLSHALLKSHGSIQWPAPQKTQSSALSPQHSTGTPRLYTDHRFATPSGRARLPALAFENRSDPITSDLPLILTTGRIRDQWHTMTKTGQVNRLRTHIDAPYCEMHPDDAAARTIRTDDIVAVRNGRGEVRVRAVVTDAIRPGVIFLPMHFGRRLSGDPAARGRANNLTSPRLDPVSREPDLKFAAVEAARYTPPKRRIVIIGAGAAALSFIEHHRRFNAVDELIILGGEDLPLYNRVQLPHYIEAGGGDESWRPLIRADSQSLVPQRTIFHRNTVICRIDPASRQVIDSRGRGFGYDVLVLATGSRPAVHYDGPTPETGVFTLRSRKDADAILAACPPRAGGSSGNAAHAVIQGGGLLGLELADALRARGCGVSILQRSDRLMGKQLDGIASGHLAEELALRGIRVLFHAAPVELVGTSRLEAVRVHTASPTESHAAQPHEQKLPCDLFIFATGTLPNKELAGAARLDCAKGILVNPFMQTSDPHIFAIGECAQCGEHLAGTTAAAGQQAQALAEYLRGNEHEPFRMTPQAAILKIRGLELAAGGLTDPPAGDESFETVTLHDPRRRLYQKCLIRNDRLIGAICMGDRSRFGQFHQWIASGLELESLRQTLLHASACSPEDAGPVICSCHNVGRETLRRAAAESPDLPALCRLTRAGTGCGSCKPELAAFLAADHSQTPPRAAAPSFESAARASGAGLNSGS